MKALNQRYEARVNKFLFLHHSFIEMVRNGQGYSLFATDLFTRTLEAWRALPEDERKHLEDTVPNVAGTYPFHIETFSDKVEVEDGDYRS